MESHLSENTSQSLAKAPGNLFDKPKEKYGRATLINGGLPLDEANVDNLASQKSDRPVALTQRLSRSIAWPDPRHNPTRHMCKRLWFSYALLQSPSGQIHPEGKPKSHLECVLWGHVSAPAESSAN